MICRASRVRASDEVLRQLALDLDARINNHGPAEEVELKVSWAISNKPEEWGGSPQYEDGLWIWPHLLSRNVSPGGINDVLAGCS